MYINKYTNAERRNKFYEFCAISAF